MKHVLTTFIVLPLVMAFLGCSTPLTTREKGAGIGALGGAAAGGIIGSAVHHPAAGALIGGALGAGGGALIGDQLQVRSRRSNDSKKRLTGKTLS